eukprot:3775133-Pyramimonas_sp.AAC.1
MGKVPWLRYVTPVRPKPPDPRDDEGQLGTTTISASSLSFQDELGVAAALLDRAGPRTGVAHDDLHLSAVVGVHRAACNFDASESET